MPANNILSQDEIDALLSGMDAGDVETTTEEEPAREGVQLYDFESQDRIIRGRLPTLEMINERFGRRLRQSFFELLHRSTDLSVGTVQMLKFGEYVQGLFMPASMNLVKLKPLRGTALVTFDPRLVFALVDSFFGGNGQVQTKIEGREFTASEQRVIALAFERVLGDLKAAWDPVLEVELEHTGTEINPHFATIATPSEVVAVTVFDVELDAGGGGLHVALPYAMLEPVRELLETGVQSDRAERDDRWVASLRSELDTVDVELASTLTEVSVTLGELIKLKPGDIVPAELPESVLATVGGVPVFRGKFGTSGGNLALKVIEFVRNPGGALAGAHQESGVRRHER